MRHFYIEQEMLGMETCLFLENDAYPGRAQVTHVCLFVQGANKFGTMKFPGFSRFSRPSKQSFPYNYKVKT